MPSRGLDDARARDARDPLRAFRDRFYLPPDKTYLDGNSLGLASRDAESAVLQALDDWKTRAIDGWLEAEPPWFYLGEQLGARPAELVGALAGAVVVTGGTTVNLHSLVATFYRPEGRRTRIAADALNFPSDLYALAAQLRLRGLDPAEQLVLVPSRDGRTIDEDDVIAAIGPDTALVVLPSVLYRGGQLLDLERLTRAAHERGVPIGFDLSHSAGTVPHRLHDWGVDFAFWCTYKYLNAGPGAVGSLFVHERHFGAAPALAGWWGSDKARQFDMAYPMAPAADAGAWQIGTIPVLSAAALLGTLGIHAEAGIERIRAKSLALTDYLIELADRLEGFTVGTPREHARRGGHVALEHPEAVQIARALKEAGVVPDFRPPNVIRLAPVALYTSFEDVWRAVDLLGRIVYAGAHRRLSPQRGVVA